MRQISMNSSTWSSESSLPGGQPCAKPHTRGPSEHSHRLPKKRRSRRLDRPLTHPKKVCKSLRRTIETHSAQKMPIRDRSQPTQGGKVMLVLTRRLGGTIVIDGDIYITVVAVKGGRVRIGVTAPKDMAVDRQEVHE